MANDQTTDTPTGSTKTNAREQYDEKTRQFQDGADAATQKVNTGVQSAWGAVQKVFDASKR
ncbi:hypothetical protein F1188_02740 [Roseospira marina]|uniref:Uncharacterized protein n=1 Tax=Roseospira marina TaxID=140057 RepID=A0A5M6IFE7_9PROT|nr:hypothetical protein [Roseospira marina]KAA5606852.1 hypothetical protein F1188_02740 [Roseospira marina]MBB4312981.1 hypothetical protein [Roseospira marina]MBB5086246.1 hypothetical protein [Roseospira marina]